MTDLSGWDPSRLARTPWERRLNVHVHELSSGHERRVSHATARGN